MSEMVTGMGYVGTEPGVLYHMARKGGGLETVTASGPELVLKDAVEINMLEIAGKSAQEKGKNLMPDTDWLVHDATFWYVSVDLEPGTYTVSINGTVPIGIIVKKASTMTNIAVGQKYFVADERGKYNIYIKEEYVKSKTTGGDKVQLETGTTATVYEPYTNKPSPGYPADIQGVGVRTKNLIPDTKWAIFDNTYKYITLKLDPGKYVLSTNGVAPYGTIVKNADDLTLVVYYNNKFTISKSAQYIIYVNKGYAKSDTTGEDKAQLEVGDTITAYEPYGYKTELVLRGKNLLNYEAMKTLSNWMPGGYYSFKISGLKSGKTYTFAADSIPEEAIEGLYVCIKENPDTWDDSRGCSIYHAVNGTRQRVSFFNSAKDTMYFNVSGPYLQNNLNRFIQLFTNMRLYEGVYTTDTIPPYEPYTHQTIPVYHRDPLHGISANDRIGQQGGIWGVKRNYKTLTLNGTESWSTHTQGDISPGSYCYAVLLSWIDIATGAQTSLCTHFKNVKNAWGWFIGYPGAYGDHPSLKYKYFVSDISTLDNFKTWLAEQYAAGTPVTLVYQFVTPTWEPLPAETQAALNNLKPCGTTTFITTTDPLKPEITAKFKRRK